ncbi:hypothetical protein [Candidatus Electronema sp. JM]
MNINLLRCFVLLSDIFLRYKKNQQEKRSAAKEHAKKQQWVS